MQLAPKCANSTEHTEANCIAEGLFLGAASAAEDLQALRKRHISHILICHPDLPAAHGAHFTYGRVALADTLAANLLKKLPVALEFLCAAREAGTGIFLCCQQGISRSTSCLVALLMFEQGRSFDEALDVCRRRRPNAFPNLGFQAQLRFFGALLERLWPGGSVRLPWRSRLQSLRDALPRGSLESSSSPLELRRGISDCIERALCEAEALASRCASEPRLVADRQAWRCHRQLFEHLLLYKALPQGACLDSLSGRAKALAARLRHVGAAQRSAIAPAALADAGSISIGGGGNEASLPPRAIAEALDRWVEFLSPHICEGNVPLGEGYDSSGSERAEADKIAHGDTGICGAYASTDEENEGSTRENQGGDGSVENHAMPTRKGKAVSQAVLAPKARRIA